MTLEHDIEQYNLIKRIDEFLENEGFVPSFPGNKIPIELSQGTGVKVERTKGVFKIKIHKNEPHLEFTLSKLNRLSFMVFLCFGVDVFSFEHFLDYFNLTRKYYNI